MKAEPILTFKTPEYEDKGLVFTGTYSEFAAQYPDTMPEIIPTPQVIQDQINREATKTRAAAAAETSECQRVRLQEAEYRALISKRIELRRGGVSTQAIDDAIYQLRETLEYKAACGLCAGTGYVTTQNKGAVQCWICHGTGIEHMEYRRI